MIFGNKIRSLREDQGLVLRQLAALLEIDTATMSKMERGDRYVRKEHIPILSQALNIEYQELYTLWLADKIYNLVKEDINALDALKVVEKELYQKAIKKD